MYHTDRDSETGEYYVFDEDMNPMSGPYKSKMEAESACAVMNDPKTIVYDPAKTEGLGINPKDAIAAKKAPLGLIPKIGLIEVARVMELGAKKYGPYNWRENAVKEQVYIDAASRHLMLAEYGEDQDDESAASHYAHVISCMLILLDAKATGNLIDNRNKSLQLIDAMKKDNEPLGGAA